MQLVELSLELVELLRQRPIVRRLRRRLRAILLELGLFRHEFLVFLGPDL